MTKNPFPFTSMIELRNFNASTGHYFFSDGALRAFRSRIGSRIFAGRFFITSERFSDSTPRLYSVREILPDGSTSYAEGTVFQQFTSHQQATRFAQELK
jgi:hypothetical protein